MCKETAFGVSVVWAVVLVAVCLIGGTAVYDRGSLDGEAKAYREAARSGRGEYRLNPYTGKAEFFWK